MQMKNRNSDPAEGSREKIDRQLESDANDLNDTAPYGNAKVHSTKADFDRNREGLYGGLPEVREKKTTRGGAKQKPGSGKR